MDGLRWLLLLFGLLVIAGVYLVSRRERTDNRDSDEGTDRVEPLLPESTADSNDDTEADIQLLEGNAESDAGQQKIVTLRVVAGDKGAFPGDELVLSLRGIGMQHGRFGIFHRYEGAADGDVIFSVASLVEPGSFDLENIKEQQIPGISMFMVIPGPIDSAEAFDMMTTTARALSQSLNAELLDESGSTLSIQRERYLREEIIQFQHGIKVA